MNRIKTVLLLSILTVLMVFIGSALGGKTGMVPAFFIACAMNFFSCWFSGKIVLEMYSARKAPLHDMKSCAVGRRKQPFRRFLTAVPGAAAVCGVATPPLLRTMRSGFR